MASSSPAPTATGTAPAISSVAPPSFLRAETPTKTQRGLNKPKCIQCGNVARSRCPYHSCKSCCSKAQNPCHIHVLKSSTPFPEKTSNANSPSVEQKSSEPSSSGTALRMPSLRQLSNAFAQFSNLQIPIRPKKHLTRKEALSLNEWRFSKLNEFKDRNLETENEAFDRYMRNISLLEEVLHAHSITEGMKKDGTSPSELDHVSEQADAGTMTSWVRSDEVRADRFREKIRHFVDEGLKKLDKFEVDDGASDVDDENKNIVKLKKVKNLQAERVSAFNDMIDKLNKARNEEDLKSCLELKSQLFTQCKVSGQPETSTSTSDPPKDEAPPKMSAEFCFPRLVTTTDIDEETLSRVDAHFCTLEQIEDL